MRSGPATTRASSAVDRDDDHHDAVGRELLAVAQHRFADVADARAVDHDVAAVGPADLVAAVVRELEHVAVFDDVDVLGSTPVFSASRPCVTSIRYSPCTGMKCFGRTRLSIRKQLFLRGVARDVRVAVEPWMTCAPSDRGC